MHAKSPPTPGAPPIAAASFPSRLRESLGVLLASIYPEQGCARLTGAVLEAFFGDRARPRRRGRTPSNTLWSQRDSYLICYGNSLQEGRHKPLDLLRNLREAVRQDNG